MECPEIRYVVGDPLARRLMEADDVVQLHVRTRTPPFSISGTAGRIVLKFCIWLETYKFGVLQKLSVGYRCMCARAHPYSVSRKRLDGLC